MPLINFFFSQKKTPANIAKERLHIIVANKKLINNNISHYFYQLKNDLLAVIYKYIQTDPNIISIQLKEKNNTQSVLELNIILKKIKHNINNKK